MTARAAKPEKIGPPDAVDESELDPILPPIDENDPEWQDYVRRKVRESLHDPRPPIPAEEVHRRILERHEAYLKRGA